MHLIKGTSLITKLVQFFTETWKGSLVPRLSTDQLFFGRSKISGLADCLFYYVRKKSWSEPRNEARKRYMGVG